MSVPVPFADRVVDIEAFDLNSIGMDFIEDPFPVLRALRDSSPVHRNRDGSVFLTRHADLDRIYHSRAMSSDKQRAFGEKFGRCPLYTHHTTSLIFNDPPYHTTVRRLLAFAFTPRKLADMAAFIEATVERLLDRMADLGACDIIPSFASALPTEIISFMLGVPESQRHHLRGYSLAILGALDPVVPANRLAAGNRAVTEFGALLSDLIDHRRRHPEATGPGEVLDALIFGEVDGRRLTSEELVQNCIFLLNAGHETTTSLVGNAVGLLLDHPDEFRQLVADPTLIETAIEEVLRFESPLQIGNRLATEPIELSGGEVLEAGTYIHTSIGGANRDPGVFDAPEQVDIGRQKNRHVAFASGIHVCLGAALARLEGRIAVGRLVRRFPTLVSDGPRERVPLARFRGYSTLPVRI